MNFLLLHFQKSKHRVQVVHVTVTNNKKYMYIQVSIQTLDIDIERIAGQVLVCVWLQDYTRWVKIMSLRWRSSGCSGACLPPDNVLNIDATLKIRH